MAKKREKQKAGVPEWVMTYGDLMSLLLVFFVLIVSFSEIKQEDEFKARTEQIKEAFGLKGGGGRVPSILDPFLSYVVPKEEMHEDQQKEPNKASTDQPGIHGEDPEVVKVREGLQYTIGGRVTFEPGSADLTEEARHALRALVEEEERIRGTNNILELHGHAASMELHGQPEGRFDDLWALSFARAQAVYEYLISDEIGLNPQRFRIVAVADHQPIAQRAYTAAQQVSNRRVAVIFSENLISQYTGPESNEDAAPTP
ncbi:MAG: OmpA/MotB family protein [Phycisphaeraceae bacterium]